jgi:hypothetical protein
MPAGRPSLFKEEFVDQGFKLCLLGATDKDLADFFEVDEATVNRWKEKHPEFCESLKNGKDAADSEVANKLYRRALGYSHEAVKIALHEGAPVYAPYTEHYPPDTTACIFWLKNRQRGRWRDKVDAELTGKDGAPIQIENTSDLDVARRLAFLLEKGLRAASPSS